MKHELLYHTALHSLQEVRETIAEKVVCYNTLRPHMRIGNRCPCEMAQATGLQAKLWGSWRMEAILRAQSTRLAGGHQMASTPPSLQQGKGFPTP